MSVNEYTAVHAGRRTFLHLAAAMACTVPAWASASGTSTAAQGATPESNPNRLLAYLKDLRLVDQQGRQFDPSALLGHLTLVQFIFTQCSAVCPVQTRALVELREQLPAALRARVQMLSISLDPLSDTPAVLREYAHRLGADQPGWRFLTGNPADVSRLADALVLFPPQPRPGQPATAGQLSAVRQAERELANASTPGRLQAHATGLWLLDERSDVRQRYSGDPIDLPRLKRELAALDALSRELLAKR